MQDQKAESSAPNRFERRRTRTRQAFIGAARQILAEQGRSDVSIQEIAERADAGFGSFYNHFDSKTALFDAAVEDALEEHGKLIDSVTAEIDDPAEVFTVSIRLTLQLADTYPELTRILRYRGLPYVHADTGLAARALRDIEAGDSSGRFRVGSPHVALSAVGGSLLGLLDLKASKPERTDAGTEQEMTEIVLRMLGMSAEDAHEMASRPLPEIPA